MTRSKLSDADKQTIVQQFREPDQTIAELARQFEVSSSTIRRLLKRDLSEQEYETLVAAKSSGKSGATAQKVVKAKSPAPPTLKPKIVPKQDSIESEDTLQTEEESTATAPELQELIAEIEHDLDEDLAEIEEDASLEDEDLESFEDDDDDEVETAPLPAASDVLIQINPLTDAVIPKPCYLVVDRTAELITRPLKEFGDLGQIPEVESQSKTLPIFENHRVARRFSQRSQRVIKVPSGNLLTKTGPHLSAKGITRLLINGRVYAL